jgi:predicted regulator of amino acid metabolism with ACT domain
MNTNGNGTRWRWGWPAVSAIVAALVGAGIYVSGFKANVAQAAVDAKRLSDIETQSDGLAKALTENSRVDAQTIYRVDALDQRVEELRKSVDQLHELAWKDEIARQRRRGELP